MKRKGSVSLYTVIIAVFSFICLIFSARLINLQFNAQRTQELREQSEISVETKVIQALRGNICDRNGNVLVSSAYSYDIIFDYDSMPDKKLEFNKSVLTLLYAVEHEGQGNLRKSDLYPFVGSYPSLSFSEEAAREGSATKAALDRIIAREELKESTADELVSRIVKKYGLDEKKDDGTPLYTDAQINSLLRIYYDMMRLQFSSVQPYTLVSGVGVEFVSYVKELSIPGVSDRISAQRTYLYPGYASHILGRVGSISAETWDSYKENGYKMSDTVGIDGCEYAFEEYLRGIDGVLTIERNAKGEIVKQYVSREPVAGKDVYLTIDIETQIAAEDALKKYMQDHGKEKGSSVAIDPQSGDILALASYPTFDLSTFSESYSSLASNENSPLLNRAVYATYAPGSTYKIAVALAGLENGKTPSSCICAGGYFDHNMSIKCENHAGITSIDLNSAITYSCNAYFIKLGYDTLGSIDTMTRYAALLGLGQSTGIELPEKTGQIACPDNAAEWTDYEAAASYIGQSIHKYTPLQVTSYIATVANGGTRYAAHLLHSVKTFSGETVYSYEKQVLSSVGISSSSLNAIKNGMASMVSNSPTASLYMYDVEGISGTVCGKSGTAQIGGGKQNCWFSAFAPKDSPKIAVTTVIENGDTGASVSEIDARIMGAYLNK